MSTTSDQWFELTDDAYSKLLKTKNWSSLTEPERELAALWRLQADVMNGGYIQFYGNWDEETITHSLIALEQMGAKKTAKMTREAVAMIRKTGNPPGCGSAKIKERLSESQYEKIMNLSYQFMDLPEPLDTLGLKRYS